MSNAGSRIIGLNLTQHISGCIKRIIMVVQMGNCSTQSYSNKTIYEDYSYLRCRSLSFQPVIFILFNRFAQKTLRRGGGSDNLAEAVAKLCVELDHVTKETRRVRVACGSMLFWS